MNTACMRNVVVVAVVCIALVASVVSLPDSVARGGMPRGEQVVATVTAARAVHARSVPGRAELGFSPERLVDLGTEALSGTVRVTTSGYRNNLQMEHPDTWYEQSTSYVAILSTDAEAEEEEAGPEYPGVAHLAIHRGEHLCELRDCDSLIPGEVTQTTTVAGFPAVDYTLPTESYEGRLTTYRYIAVDDTINSGEDAMYLELTVGVAKDQSTHDALMRALEGIVDSITRIPDYVTDLALWSFTEQDTPADDWLLNYTIVHPPGSSVTELGGQIIVNVGGPPTGAMSVIFEPGRPGAEWDSADRIFGSWNIRLLGSVAGGGTRTTEYIIEGRPAPIKVTAAVVDYPYGSEGYWLVEQYVWAIMENSALTYWGMMPPYP